MRTSRFADSRIIAILSRVEAGALVPQLCGDRSTSGVLFYKSRPEYGDMETSVISRRKELEAKNRRLKKMRAGEQLETEMAQDALRKGVTPFAAKG